MKDCGIDAKDLKSVLKNLTKYMAGVTSGQANVSGVLILAGIPLLVLPDPFTKFAGGFLIFLTGMVWIDEKRWNRWKETLEDLKDAAD
jgi:hypothetical protein